MHQSQCWQLELNHKDTDGRENRLYVQQNLQETAAALPHMHIHTGQAFTHVHVLFSHCILSIPLPSNKEVEGEGNLGRKGAQFAKYLLVKFKSSGQDPQHKLNAT